MRRATPHEGRVYAYLGEQVQKSLPAREGEKHQYISAEELADAPMALDADDDVCNRFSEGEHDDLVTGLLWR